jgi:small subunit ribosomal protein S20
MPQHKSAKKRVKTNLKSQARNRAARSTLKTALKQVHDMPEDSKDQAVGEHQSLMDRAANKGIVHRNKAARLKSRFTRGSK